MKKKSIKKNYIYNLCYQVLTLITPLITTPYVSRVLGADGVGISSYTNAVTTYFILIATLGTTDYAQREIAYRQEYSKERTKVFWEIVLLRCITGLVSIILFAFFIFSSEYRVIFLIQAVNIFAVIFDISWFFQGMEEFAVTSIRNIAVKILNILFIFVFVREKNDLMLYIASIAFSTLIGNILLWGKISKYLIPVSIKDIHPFSNLIGVIQLFIPTIAIQVSAVLDKTMLGLISEAAFENGYYEQADRIEKICLTIVSSLGIVMIPRIANVIANKNDERLKYYIYRAYRFIWMMSLPMMFGLISIADLFVPWFFGPGYEKTAVLLKLLSILLCVVGLSSVTGVQYFVPAGKQNLYTRSVIYGLIVNIIMNAILIPQFFSIGAAIATIISEIVVTGSQFYMVRKDFSIKNIFKLSSNYLISSFVMFAVLILLNHYIVNGWQGMIAMTVLGAFIYVIILIILKDEMIKEIEVILKRAAR